MYKATYLYQKEDMVFKSWLGIDVSKDKLDVVLLQSECKQVGTFANDQAGCKKLVRWLVNQQVDALHACLEATGQYSLLAAEYLYQAGYRVSVVKVVSESLCKWLDKITQASGSQIV